MSSYNEIKNFLKEEIEKMNQQSEGSFYDVYDDDFYDNFNIDDCDGAYYENAYGDLVDFVDEQSEQMADEYDELEDFYMDQPYLIEPVKTELQKAKELRDNNKYEEAITICDELLKKNANNRYAVDLKIAALGDSKDSEAYNVAISYMEKYAQNLDFIRTMFGLLQKMNHREDDFVKKLYKYCPVCLEVYTDMLGENNPKKSYLMNIMLKGDNIS